MARSTLNVPGQHFVGDITKCSIATCHDGITPKGRNVSGRPWKLRRQLRASSLITLVPSNNKSKSWEHKQRERQLRKSITEQETEMRNERIQSLRDKKERKLENDKRRAENEFKSASKHSQIMTKDVNLKLKAMNKKQLRQIKKTRMNSKTGVVEYVSPYAK